jgi:hypothetical protein
VTWTKVSLRLPAQTAHTEGVTPRVFLVVFLLALSAGVADARGFDHGRGDGESQEVRVGGTCGRGATFSLRVRTEDRGIEARFRLRQTRGYGLWRVTIVHENRVASRATATTTRSDDSFELRRSFRDLSGSDRFVVHAWGPSGLACRATATLVAGA